MTEATTAAPTDTTSAATVDTGAAATAAAAAASAAAPAPATQAAAPAAAPAPAATAPATSATEGDKTAADATLKTPEAFAEEQAAQHTALRDGWKAELTADPEIGGEKLAENLATAKAAMLAVATPKMQAILANSGLGDHPEVVRMFLKIAPAFSTDKFVPGGNKPATVQSAAKVLYPNSA